MAIGKVIGRRACFGASTLPGAESESASVEELRRDEQAILDQCLVHKFAPVADVERAKSEGQPDADALDRLNNEAAFSHHKRRRLRPTAGNVSQYEAIDLTAAVNFAESYQ
jgi:hypothetical protein